MILEIIVVVLLVKKVISWAKQKGVKATSWAIITGLSYGIPSISSAFLVGVLIGLGTIDDSWNELPNSLLFSLGSMIIGLLFALIPLLILKNKPDANPDIASPFEKEKDIDESNTDILDA